MDKSNPSSFDIENRLALWENSMIQELQSLSPFSAEHSIYKVPKKLLEGNKNAYKPQVVSVGPIHHGMEDLKDVEDHKKWYLKEFIELSNLSLGSLIEIVKKEEERLRACYQKDTVRKCEEFVQIILVDTAFTMVFLIKFFLFRLQPLYSRNDCIFSSVITVEKVKMDVMLLENQLPFFILVEFYGHLRRIPSLQGEKPSILSLCHVLCEPFIDFCATTEKWKNIDSCNVKHLLDFLRYMAVPLDYRPPGSTTTINIPSITKLHQAGVRFEVRWGKKFEFDFKEGTFVITRFRLGPDDEIYLRNLLAFEQCSDGWNYITDYVGVMAQLLNTQNDVDLLIENNILEDVKHSNKTQLSLLHEIISWCIFNPDAFQFAELFKELNAYCGKSRHKWIADLKQKYFSTPWTTISVIAGFVLLVLTLIQTVCSVIAIQFSNKNGVQN